MTTDIQITKSGTEPGEVSFKVEVPAERVQKEQHKAAKEFAKRARLPGFRKGKAPIGVVKTRYQDAIREQVLREVIGESWKATIDQESLEPIAEPHVHDLKFEDGAPLTFELHVEVKPELKLERIGGFTLTRSVPPVDDAMVQKQIDDLRKQRGPWVPIEDRPPAPGEMVRGTLATIEDGTVVEPKEFHIVLGEGQAIPDVEERIMTLTAGESVDAVVKFPEDFNDPEKRGQAREVRIALIEAKRQELPEIDDAFAREVGDFENVADFEQFVRKELESEARREADLGVRRQVIEQITAANEVPTPRSLVDRLLRSYAEAYKVPQEQIESFLTEFRPIAESQVRRDLILDHVATAQDLRTSEEELDDRIGEIARQRKVEPGQVYTQLQKSNRLKELEQSMTEEKVFDYLVQQSTVTEG